MDINIDEFKKIMSYILSNNTILEDQGKKKTAIEIVGESGLGKTSAIMQLSDELGLQCVKLNLAQIEELGDLVGFPIREFQMVTKDAELKWVPEHLINQYEKLGYVVSEGARPRMSYAPPAWLPEDNSKGGILLLDDWNRADPRFIQACMELIDRGEYISWKLPSGWSIALSANPDTGDYAVNSLDNAQRTRYVSFDLEFDKNVWARWAEKEGIDGRCINFVLLNPELLKKKKGSLQKVNARSLVTFFNTIQGLDNFEATHNLAFINQIAQGCFSDDDNVVGTTFSLFINNKLDKIIQPERVLNGKWKTVSEEIKDNINKEGTYRADIAAILTIRFVNHLMSIMDKGGYDSKVIVDRILEIVNHKEELLTMDLIFNLTKKLVSKDRKTMSKLLLDPKLMKVILS